MSDDPNYTPQGSDGYFEKMGNVHAARAAADRRLKDLHRDEYERIHGDEREARGLPRHTKPKTPRYLELLERVSQLEAELAAVKGEA